ncbi:hypothetical protein PBY51_004037 [Eleginops maclovinus]|uniref:Uncharacterized protein n=1 Tax=Eleginops maclovinus TaxID=56733 RepID=A0AAN7XW29_ELEMC|nr:hypothetical protein PBY51_004037 [Eleginops maclovinus]
MLRDRCMWNPSSLVTRVVGVTGFIYRAADMSPVRKPGGSTREPTSGQVMFTLMTKQTWLALDLHKRHGSVAPLLCCTHTVTDAWCHH